MKINKKYKSKCGCKFGCAGGCCGIIIIIIIVIIVAIITGGIWLKKRTYLDQPERIKLLASEICDYKLPDDFVPLVGMDYETFRLTLFVKGEEINDQNVSTVIFFDTTITNFADYFDEVAAKIVVSSGGDNEMKIKTIDLGSFFKNDTKISCQEQIIYIEEENTSFTIYKASFPKNDRIVIAWYMAAGMTNIPSEAKAIINSIGKPGSTRTN